jgi:signal transduction histidine kinase
VIINTYKIIRLKVLLTILLLLHSPVAAQSSRTEIDSVNSTPYQFIVSNLQESITIFSRNVSDAKEINYKYGEAKALANLGLAQYLKGEYEESTSNYLTAIKIFEELNDYYNLAFLYSSFGYQMKRRDLKNSMGYMRKGIQIAEQYDLKDVLATNYDNFGVLHEMNDDLDSAVFYYRRALQLKYDFKDSIGIPYSLNNLAGIHGMKGNFKEALKYLKESDKYRSREKGDFGRAENLSLYGDIYRSMGEIESAIKYYQDCLKLSTKLNHTYLVQYGYEQLAKLYESSGNSELAVDNYKKYYAYKDSMMNAETKVRITDLQLDYETEKKDRQISESKLQIEERTNQLLISAGVIILLIIISGWIYRNQRIKRIRIKRELELNNQIKQSELEKKLADEKIRVSRELHDNIGSQLTFMISSLDNLTYAGLKGITTDKLNNLSTFGRNTLKELRNTIWAMNHEDAGISDFVLKLNELKHQVNDNVNNLNLKIINEIKRSVVLRASQILNLHRIVQEAVQNVIKYSEANIVEIKFEETLSGFSMIIKDNGKGFDAGNQERGNGLKNMKYRCEDAGGEFDIKSSPEGTVIICRMNVK